MSKNQDEMEDMKQLNATMEQEMQRCRQKEVELLEFTQKLTEINVQLQSDFTSLDEKVNYLYFRIHFNVLYNVVYLNFAGDSDGEGAADTYKEV